MQKKKNLSEPLIILGIDPGTQKTGYAVVRCQARRFVRLSSGTWLMGRYIREEERLYRLQDLVIELLTLHKCQSLALEAAFYGKNVQVILKLGRMQGVLLATAAQQRLSVHMYAPRAVKQAIAGHGNAQKEVLGRRVWMLLGEPAEEQRTQLDESDALAVALCHGLRST